MADNNKGSKPEQDEEKGIASGIVDTAGTVAGAATKGVSAVYGGAKWTLGAVLGVPFGLIKSAGSFITDPVNGLVNEATAFTRKTSAVVFPMLSVAFGFGLTIPYSRFFGISRRSSMLLFFTSTLGMTLLTSRDDILWCLLHNSVEVSGKQRQNAVVPKEAAPSDKK